MKKFLLLFCILLMLPFSLMAQDVAYTFTASTTVTTCDNIIPGKWYKFQQGGEVSTHHMSSNGTYMQGLETSSHNLDEAAVWTLVETETGKYKIKNFKGEYLAQSAATSANYWAKVTTDANSAVIFTKRVGSVAGGNNTLFTITTPPATDYAYLHFDFADNGTVEECGFYHNADGQNSQFKLYEVEVGYKVYTIKSKGQEDVNNANNDKYMYDDGTGTDTETGIGTGLKATTLNVNDSKFYWIFEPSGNGECFYIKNLATGRYIQTSKLSTLSSAISMGPDPVEYKKGHNGNNNTATWWLASTDNTTFDTSTDNAARGLNYGSDNILSYYIKTGRENSYWIITDYPKKRAQVRITKAKFATLYYADNNLALPTNVEAWVFTEGDNSNSLQAKKISGKGKNILKRGTAVLLKSTEEIGEGGKTYEFLDATDYNASCDDSENLLHGGPAEHLDRTYILSGGDYGVGFYKAGADFTNDTANHKAFLELPSTSDVRSFAFSALFDGTATGIEATDGEAVSGISYDLSGRRVAQPARGLYIVNGKKCVVK